MPIFGLGNSDVTAVKDKQSIKAHSSKSIKKAKKIGVSSPSQEEEAKALLEKMDDKAEADECPFC